MATSGSKTWTVTSQDTLEFTWEEVSQDISTNKTKISWKLWLIAGSSGKISSTASKDWSVTVNGTKYSGTNTVGISNGASKTLASGTTTIAHNSDGTKTFAYSISQEFAITFSGTYIGTKTGSGTGTLDTIPRKSTLTVAGGTLGTAQTLTITEQTSTHKHKLIWTCMTGTASSSTEGYILGGASSYSTSNSVGWTPPLALASQNTTGTSVSIKFVLVTYTSDGTYLGENSYTKTFKIPSDVVPTVSFTLTDSEGYAATYGDYIQTLSKAQVAVTAEGSYGSTIKSYSTTVDGKTYTSASFTTSAISGTGDLQVLVTVTDSRGRTATKGKLITVIPYAAPKISEVSLCRCNSLTDATCNPSGAFMSVTFTASVSDLNEMNTAKYSVQYKKTTESDYATEVVTAYEDVYSVTDGVFIFAADTASSYDVILVAEDKFQSKQKTQSGSTIRKVLSSLKVGFGVAIGKVAELVGFFDIGINAIFRENIYMGHFHDTEKNIYFKNNAAESDMTYEEDNVYPHNCKIYGGAGTSPIGIGMYDSRNSRRILSYNDHENYLYTESVFRHQIAQGYPSTETTLSGTDWNVIELDSMNPTTLKGKYLAISGGGIICKRKGVVKVSGQCYVKGLTAYDLIGVGVKKNSTRYSWFYRKQNYTTIYNSVTDYVVDVAEGDILYLEVRNYSGARGTVGSGRGYTRLVVEYVG